MADLFSIDDENFVIPDDEEEETPTEIIPPTPVESEAVAPSNDGEVVEDSAQTPVETPEVDEDAWRNVKISDSPKENHELILSLKEKSPAFKRAFNTQVANEVRRQTQQPIQESQERVKELETEIAKQKLTIGNLYWGRMTKEQTAAVLAQDPANLQAYNNYLKVKKEYEGATSAPKVPDYLKNLYSKLEDMVDQAAIHLTEEDVESARKFIRNPALYAQYKDAPDELISNMYETLDKRIKAANNVSKSQQPAATTAVPAKSTGSAVTPEVVRGNPKASQFKPESTPRVGGGASKLRPITDEEAENMPPDEWDAYLEKAGAKDSNELRKMGLYKIGA